MKRSLYVRSRFINIYSLSNILIKYCTRVVNITTINILMLVNEDRGIRKNETFELSSFRQGCESYFKIFKKMRKKFSKPL